MAWANKKPEPKKDQAEHKKHKNEVRDLLLWCQKQEITKGGNWLRMSCKLSSAPADGEKYGVGIWINVMARIQPDSDGTMTQIEEREYGKTWIAVSGQLNAADWNGKNGINTDITIWADAVKLADE